MANALAELFGNIATAIKAKTGDGPEVKYKPIDFPEKIESISTGSSRTVMFASGEFSTTTPSCVVEHNMGVIPDLIMIVLLDDAGVQNDTIVAAIGTPKSMYSVITDKYGYGMGSFVATAALGGLMQFNKAFDSGHSYLTAYGLIRDVTTTTFTVGGGTNSGELATETPIPNPKPADYVHNNVPYVWFALSGI